MSRLEIVLSIGPSRGVNLAVDGDAQVKALRLRMYVLCSECAHLIDLAQGDRPDIESIDVIRHKARRARVLVGNARHKRMK